MFEADDFQLPLEKQLRLRIINEEIDACTDVDALRENLKNCTQSLMTYQHLLTVCLRKQIEQNIEGFSLSIMEEVKKILNDAGAEGETQN